MGTSVYIRTLASLQVTNTWLLIGMGVDMMEMDGNKMEGKENSGPCEFMELLRQKHVNKEVFVPWQVALNALVKQKWLL